MTVYRDTNATVTFEHPHPGPLTATVYRRGAQLLVVEEVLPVGGRYTIDLTYEETEFDGPLEVVWTAIDFIRTITVDVVTPLVSLSKMKTLFTDTHWSDAELRELENSVRIGIQSYTRQNFGYYLGTESVVGNGEKKLTLRRRLIKVTSISGGLPGFFSIGNDGWAIYMGNKNLLTTKEAPPEDYMDNNTYMTQGVIVVPDTYWKQFRVGAEYSITGEWGYYSVPESIEQAAMLLANDYACGDSTYRDRFVESMKAADWNFTFNDGAFRGMGNKRVDDLLDPFRRSVMIII